MEASLLQQEVLLRESTNSKIPISYNCDENNHNLLKAKQNKFIKNNGTFKESLVIPFGSTVATLCEDGRLWTHDTIVDWRNANHSDQSYRIQLTKTGCIITRNT